MAAIPPVSTVENGEIETNVSTCLTKGEYEKLVKSSFTRTAIYAFPGAKEAIRKRLIVYTAIHKEGAEVKYVPKSEVQQAISGMEDDLDRNPRIADHGIVDIIFHNLEIAQKHATRVLESKLYRFEPSYKPDDTSV